MRSLSAGTLRCVAAGIGLLLALLWVVQPWAKELNGGLRPATMTVGFTKAAFLNMNPNDVKSAFKVLAQTVGRKRGYLVTSKTQIFEDTSDFKTAIKIGAVNLPIFDSWTYLSMAAGRLVTPVYVASDQGMVGKKYLLLTRRGDGLNALADLRVKDVAEFEIANASLGHLWLETLLLKNRLGNHETFFNSTIRVGKPSLAVLPVFFGQKHACVVDATSFEVMNDLNPQVGKKLQSVVESKTFLDGIICVSNIGWSSDEFKLDVMKALGELHFEPAGQQILTLFKTSQLVPFKESHLETVRTLQTTYNTLRTEHKP